MVRWLRQTAAVTALNLRTIPARLSSSAVAIVGIAGVVVVLVSVLSIAAGFSAAMRQSGSPQRALVMRSGADSEMTSGLGGPSVDLIKQAPGIRRQGQTPLASAELYVIIDLPEEVVSGLAGQCPDARHRADRRPGPRGSVDHRRPDAAVRDERGHRRTRRQRAVRRPECRRRRQVRPERLARGRHVRGRRRRGGNGDLG